ncbi:MAG: ATP-binding cassette domain-containing protein [Dermatophilaceae bacterium]
MTTPAADAGISTSTASAAGGSRLITDSISVTVGRGPSATTVLEGFSASFTGVTAVMGPSGSGKTTLLRTLCGQVHPNSGYVLLDGEAVRAEGSGWLDPRFAMVHQDHLLVDFLTVAENLTLAAELRDRSLSRDDCLDILARFEIDDLADRLPRELSGGQQQRAAIARSLAVGAHAVLADEPTAALDRRVRQIVVDSLRRVAATGAVVVVATHDEAVAEAADTVVDLRW